MELQESAVPEYSNNLLLTSAPVSNVNKTTPSLYALYCCVLFLFPLAIKAEGIIVVVRQDAEVASMSQMEIANLFLGKGQNQSHLTPYDQDNTELREHFYREVSGLSLASVRAYWAKQVFTGRGRPPVILNADQVKQLLADDPSAVIYTSADQQPDHSRIILTIGTGEKN